MLAKHLVGLSLEERQYLMQIIAEGNGGKERLNRARILLKADVGKHGEGWRDSEIAEAFYVGEPTVARTRRTFVEEGIQASVNRKVQIRTRKRIIGGEEEAYLIAMACGAPPEGHCRWTLRMLANRMVELNYVDTISYETIRRTLKKTNLSRGKKRNGAFQQNPTPPSSAKWKKSSTCIKRSTIPSDPLYVWTNPINS